eukprot:TRINITY_DN10528_c0_g1_i11.p1 TRINITY_DN10528_c0_g1~~TRINITY_DN10528_c0_g1_i11.p1  ORF type:complete len:294 (+),score=65.42 TRINITY_DN10528_c0_g1_i11:106-987(+)
MDDEILVSFEELQSHASREDAWIQVEGIVYNLTDLYAAHAEELPDTFEQLFDVAGADATEVFQDISQGQDFLELLSDFKVGIIHQRDGDDAPGPADSPLTEDLMATNLSRLTKTPDGTSFAYSRIALTGKSIGVIDILAKYPYIQYVELTKNMISDPSILGSLKFLLLVNLSENKLVQFSISSRPYLKYLDISKNRIVALSSPEGVPFHHPSLVHLNLNNNRIQSLDGLEAHQNLRFLELRGNRIISLTYLPDMPGLEELYLADNQIAVLTNLEKAPQLKRLHARGTFFSFPL